MKSFLWPCSRQILKATWPTSTREKWWQKSQSTKAPASKEIGFVNGMEAAVLGMNKNNVVVRTKQNRILAVHPWTSENQVVHYPLHLGYASTVHKVQGATLPHVTRRTKLYNFDSAACHVLNPYGRSAFSMEPLNKALEEATGLLPHLEALNFGKGSEKGSETATLSTLKRRRVESAVAPPSEEAVKAKKKKDKKRKAKKDHKGKNKKEEAKKSEKKKKKKSAASSSSALLRVFEDVFGQAEGEEGEEAQGDSQARAHGKQEHGGKGEDCGWMWGRDVGPSWGFVRDVGPSWGYVGSS